MSSNIASSESAHSSSLRNSFNGYLAGSANVGHVSMFAVLGMGLAQAVGFEIFDNPVVAATGVAAFSASVIGGIAGLIIRSDDCHQPLENNIGRGLTIAAAATAGMLALANFSENVAPTAPLTTAPAATFNIKADCKSTPIQKEIARLSKTGYKVTYSL